MIISSQNGHSVLFPCEKIPKNATISWSVERLSIPKFFLGCVWYKKDSSEGINGWF